mmetsp:Transcript_25892/g.72496  ORF Transcript_25892/g.72496 Transcript_25892/m.72496 type:complete len:370 (-) Transcript_25892:1671-2780(-)
MLYSWIPEDGGASSSARKSFASKAGSPSSRSLGTEYFSTSASTETREAAGHRSAMNAFTRPTCSACSAGPSCALTCTEYPWPKRFLRCCTEPKHLSFPLVMMVSDWQRASHSSMLWDVSTTVRPRHESWITSQRCRRACGSRPVEGSSKSTRAGFPIRAIATESLRWFPPLRAPACRSRYCCSPRVSASAASTFCMSARATPRIPMKNRMCCRTVILGSRPPNWGQYPMRDCTPRRFPRASTRSPSRLMWMEPVEGCTSPVSMRKVVVLPAPFTPSSPKHSPLGSPKLRLSTATTRPRLKRFPRPWMVSSDDASPASTRCRSWATSSSSHSGRGVARGAPGGKSRLQAAGTTMSAKATSTSCTGVIAAR